MNLGKLLLGGSLIISSLFADVSYREIVGNWEVSSVNDNRRVFFNNQYGNTVEVNINRDGTITSPYGESKHYILDNNILAIGKFSKGERLYGQIEEYELRDTISERLSYGQKCFELKVRKIESGSSSKNRMKICTEFKNENHYENSRNHYENNRDGYENKRGDYREKRNYNGN
jgi:hypothetical protein